MTTITKLQSNLDRVRYNPTLIQQVILEHLTEITEGQINIVDPTNPVVFCLESAAVNTAAFMVENATNTRKQYPAAAQTPEDVYIHMSDVDYVDRFAVPARTKFTIVARKEEIIQRMVTDLTLNVRKLIIPRNTYFTVNDVVFSMQYPVEIRELSHGGLQIVYNTDVKSPLFELTSNVIKWDVRKNNVDNEEWLYFEVDAFQFNIQTFREEVTFVTGFNRSYDFNDQFYYARVWNKSNATDNKWREIKTTHTDQVYDVNDPTVVLKVIGKKLHINVPIVYLTSGKITGALRVDIYQTKGKVSMALENYKQEAFEAHWYAIDDVDMSLFSSPLASFRTLFAYSAEVVDGGRNSLDFEELRKRVINNSVGPQQLPITNVQIEASLSNRGYSLVKDVDVVTNRVFLASRPMPVPFDEKLITAGNSSIETFITSMTAIADHPFIRSSNNRLTIPSNTVFTNENGIIRLLDATEKAAILSLPSEQLAKVINSKSYLYNPFFYVMDASRNEFELRCYHLDDPKIESVTFVDQNDSTGLEINTAVFQVMRDESGFRVAVKTKTNDLVKNLGLNNFSAQLSFVPRNGPRCSVNGVGRLAVDNEFIFEFSLNSNFDIDNNNRIEFTNFNFFDVDFRDVFSNLTETFDLVYFVNQPQDPSWQRTNIDSFLNYAGIDPLSIGINHEKLSFKFGDNLRNLWSRSRSVLQATQFQRHEQDVVLRYVEDIYKEDPVTGAKFTINEQGGIEFEILHRTGDIVFGSDNLPIYKHRAGDVVLDENNKPIPLNPSSVVRQIEMFFIDAVYLFANDTSSSTYRRQMVDTVVNWVVNDLGDINNRVLEQTRIYYYPKTNLGSIKVLVDQSVVTNIKASQVFNIQLYVNSAVYKNEDLRKFLTTATIRTLDNLMNQSVISNSKIITALKEVYSGDVISVAIQGLGGGNRVETITLLNEGDRCSIGKKLQSLPNGERIVVEDININFIEHQLSN
jgi:hypothetical protein